MENQTTRGRHPLRVGILTDLPINLQARISTGLKRQKGNTVIYLSSATVTIAQTASGEIVIVIEPP
jgi:hypothetical protein